jgi:tetratricopeptide (TPR) repeat protein
MLTDAQLIKKLRSWAANDERFARALHRTIRVPEAWEVLHNPSLLGRIDTGLKEGKELTLSLISTYTLELEGEGFQASVRLSDDLELRLEELVVNPAVEDRSMVDVSLLALAILRIADEDEERFITTLSDDCSSWASPLAIAWTDIPHAPALLNSLLSGGETESLIYITRALLANTTIEEAASMLAAMEDIQFTQILQGLRGVGEDELSRALAGEINLRKAAPRLSQTGSTMENLNGVAAVQLGVRNLDLARKTLNDAWKHSAQLSAQIADQLADLADEEENSVLELEARQQALQAYSTPLRRAWLAQTLCALNRHDEARLVLREKPTTYEEWIASGRTYQAGGDRLQAKERYRQALDLIDGSTLGDVRWLKTLLMGLEGIHESELALEAADALVGLTPANAVSHLLYAKTADAIGHHQLSSDQASISFLLQPDLDEAKEIAARNLQAIGDSSTALSYWNELSQTSKNFLPQLSSSALDAGDFHLAKNTALRILENNVDSVVGQVLLGRSLSNLGEHADALEYLEKATAAAPDDPNTWIAIAECWEALGEDKAADTALSEGIKISPQDAHLRNARANLLKRHGRYAKALVDSSIAAKTDSPEPGWLMEHAEILTELGRGDEAIPFQEMAYELQPGNLDVRHALALSYERTHQYERADRLMKDLSASSPPERFFDAGRIATKAAQAHVDEVQYLRAVEYLQIAADSGVDEPTLEYWLAAAYEGSHNFEGSIQAYSKYIDQLSLSNNEFQLESALGLGRAALSAENPELAISSIENARSTFPTNIDLIVLLSTAYLAQGEYDRAKQIARQGTDFRPNSPLPINALYQAALAGGSLEEAVCAKRRLVDLRADDAAEWLDLAALEGQIGSQESARATLAQALSLDRLDPEYLSQAASILTSISPDDRMAQRLLVRASENAPEDTKILKALASLSSTFDDDETAQQSWLRIAEIEPENTEALVQAADALQRLDRLEAAISLWQRVLINDPENAAIHARIGSAYIHKGEIERGLHHYAVAVEVAENDAAVVFEAGATFAEFGSPDDAIEILKKAVSLTPGEPGPAEELADCLMRANRPEEASVHLQDVLTGANAGASTYALASMAHMELGDIIRASHAFSEGAQLRPYRCRDAVWLSRAAMTLGRWNEAVDVLKTFSSDGENNPSIRTELASVLLRLVDLQWIFTTVLSAPAHAPGEMLVHKQVKEEIHDLLRTQAELGEASPRLSTLQTWHRLVNGKTSAESLLDGPFSSSRDKQHLKQAVAIRFLQANRPGAVEDMLTDEHSTGSMYGWATLLIGLARSDKKLHEGSRTAYEVVTRNPYLRPIAAYLNAKTYLGEGSIEDGIEQLNAGVTLWADEPHWNYELACLYERLNHPEKALPHLQQAVEVDGENGIYLVALARALRDSGQYSASEKLFDRAVQTSPKSFKVWQEAAQIAIANGNSGKAEEWFERARTLSPSDPTSLIGSARAASILGKRREAIERAQAAMRLAPDNVEVLKGMGDIMAREGKHEEALRLYNRAQKNSDDVAEIQMAKGSLFMRTNRYDEAVSEFKSAIKSSPDHDRAWGALCKAYEAQQNFDGALDAVEHAKDLAPRDPYYRLLFGRVCRKKGQLDRALDELAQAEVQSPKDPRLSLEIGIVHEERRELDKALDAYQRSINILPESVEAHMRAGLLFKNLKSYGKAAVMLEKVVELQPRSPEALQHLAAVRALQLVHGGMTDQAVVS